MTPDLVLFGVKALIRVGQQTNKALIDYAADKPTVLGNAKVIHITDKRDLLNSFFELDRYHSLSQSEPFKNLWDDTIEPKGGLGQKFVDANDDKKTEAYLFAVNAAKGDGEALAKLYDEEPPRVGEERRPQTSDSVTSLVLIEQWKPDRKPISPFGRIALAVVQVGLDYVATDPSIFGAGKTGEKVISAFAIALAKPIGTRLDADSLGTRTELINSVMVAFVSAGLETLKAHSADLISDQHLAKLLGNVLDPVIAASKTGDVLFQVQMQNILKSLAGPAAQAAFKTVAENPGAFLGKSFDSSKAAGALVSALLVESAKNPDVTVTFSEGGRLKLLSAALQVVSDKPGLFIKTGDKPDAVAVLLTDLTATLAGQLKTQVLALEGDKQVDGRALAAAIAAASLEAFGRHSTALIGTDAGWKQLVGKVAQNVLSGLTTAIKSPDGLALKQVLSEEKLAELGRIVVQEIAANPGLTQVSDARAREIIGAVAAAISVTVKEKKELLFTPDDWLTLARTMAKEVAARPAIAGTNDPRLQAAVSALATVIAGDKNSILSGADASTVARSLLAEVVGRPILLSGLNADVQQVALAVAAAMASDKNLLLSGPDWAEIAKVALSEATANPARLFGATFNSNGQALATSIVGIVVKSMASFQVGTPGSAALIVKGDVLRDATIGILQLVAGKPEVARKYEPLVQLAVTQVSAFVAGNSGAYGSAEWRALIDVLVKDILSGKKDAELAAIIANPAAVVTLIPSPEQANAMLARRAS